MASVNRSFRILTVAPFCHIGEKNTSLLQSVSIDKFSIGKAFNCLKPTFYKNISSSFLHDNANVKIEFTTISDFRPKGLLKRSIFLSSMMNILEFLQTDKIRDKSIDEQFSLIQKKWPFLKLKRHVEPEAKQRVPMSQESSLVDQILKVVSFHENNEHVRTGTSKNDGPLVHQIRQIITDTLKMIYDDPGFNRLEECWLGLWFLIKAGKWNNGLIIDVLPSSEQDVASTLKTYFDQCDSCALPDLVLVDSPMASDPYSLEQLTNLSEAGDKNLVLVIVSLKPEFFNLDSWKFLKRLPYLPHFMETISYAKWQKLRKRSSARWLAVLCNPFILREPYEYGPLGFREEKSLWGDPVWAFGAMCGKSIELFGWPFGFHRHGVVYLEDLPIKEIDGKYLPTKVHFSDERVEQMEKCGIVPLTSLYNHDSLFFPVDRCVSGHKISFQMMISQVSHFLINLQIQLEKEEQIQIEDLEELIANKLNIFLNREGQPFHFHIFTNFEKISKKAIKVFVKIKLPVELFDSFEPIILDFVIEPGTSY